MNFVYCILSHEEIINLENCGFHKPESLTAEGFVHCSFIDQVAKVANKWFAGKDNLYLIQINSEIYNAKLVVENTSGGTSLFPHTYGPITLSSVNKIIQYSCNSNGKFEEPIIL